MAKQVSLPDELYGRIHKLKESKYESFGSVIDRHLPPEDGNGSVKRVKAIKNGQVK